MNDAAAECGPVEPARNPDVELRAGNVELAGGVLRVNGAPVDWRRVVLELTDDGPPVLAVELYPRKSPP